MSGTVAWKFFLQIGDPSLPAVPIKNSNAFKTAIPTPSPGQFPTLTGINPAKFVKRGTTGANWFDPDDDDSQYNANFTISNYKVVAVSPEHSKLAAAGTVPKPTLCDANNQQPELRYNYIASADVTLAAIGASNVVAKVRQVFQKVQISPWRFAIFYEDPLEIHPGPKFTVTGEVHTNSGLYTGHSSLMFGDKVTYGSGWTIGFMPDENSHNGETPQPPNFAPGVPQASRDDPLELFGLDKSVFDTTDGNPNNDGYHELIEPSVVGQSDPFAGQRYWDNAGIIVEVSDNPNPNLPGWDGVNGHDIVKLYKVTDSNTGATAEITSASKGADKNLYTMFSEPGAITTNQTIQDNREGAQVRVATLDISKIVKSNGKDYTKSFNNPIVYMYDPSATSSARRAIRVAGGSSIPSSGLTVASNNPVYLQGDFNTGGTGPNYNNVPSNNPANLNADGTYKDPANPPDPQAASYDRAPCSIVADAVNILSNNWNDANSGKSVGERVATPTTINAAVISGIVSSGNGYYSGGAENFPRFLETWTNVSFSYYGSMIELYKSQQATANWGSGNVYVPPTRNWFFDTDFKLNAPPGSLYAWKDVKGQWTVR